MIIASYVFFALFALVSVVNCYFAFMENEKWRKITKPFCLGFLFIATVLFKPTSPFIYLGILFGLLGDILFLWQKKKWFFITGIIAFLIGHVFYLTQLILSLEGGPIQWPAYLTAAILFLALACCLFPVGKKITKKADVAIACAAYGPTLITLLVASIYLACHNSNHLPGILMTIGYLFFIFSDGTILFSSYVKKDLKRRHFYIMASYLIAQALIVTALLLI